MVWLFRNHVFAFLRKQHLIQFPGISQRPRIFGKMLCFQKYRRGILQQMFEQLMVSNLFHRFQFSLVFGFEETQLIYLFVCSVGSLALKLLAN